METGYGAKVLAATTSTGRAGTAGRAVQDEPRGDRTTPGGTAPPRSGLGGRAVASAVLTVPVVLLARWPGLDIPGEGWVELVLTTPVVLWAAWPFHRAAAVNARRLSSTMDTPVSIGVLAAYLWSTVALVASGGTPQHLYFETAAVVTTFLLVGRTVEARARASGRSALTSLLDLGAKDVAVQRIDASTRATTEVRLPVEELRVGDHFVVRPGERIATDGVVVDGASSVDAALVTGESVPAEVSAGDEVTGGALNTHGRLVVEATRVGGATTLAGITRLVAEAQTGKAEVQRLADRVSAAFVPVVITLATLTLAGWWVATGDSARALEVGVAVLIIAGPCALGLATPTAVVVGTGRAAQMGVLIRGPQVLEDTRRVDTIVLDKTGTVTTGVARLTDISPTGRLSATSALRAAAAVEAGSEHPVARAVVAAARERGLEIPPVTDVVALPGAGARGSIRGTVVTVGRRDLFDDVPTELARAHPPGTTVFLGWDGRVRATLTVADEVREDSATAVVGLAEQGLTAYLLTGDSREHAVEVARAVGIPDVRVLAEIRPADKQAEVERLEAGGRVVAVVGDGITDATALARADLGLALGSGTDVAMESADIVVVRPELSAVVDALNVSRRMLRTIKQNLAWAYGYNAAALPLAMAGLINPMLAGGAMALSSVLVVTNSLRLRRVRRS